MNFLSIYRNSWPPLVYIKLNPTSSLNHPPFPKVKNVCVHASVYTYIDFPIISDLPLSSCNSSTLKCGANYLPKNPVIFQEG